MCSVAKGERVRRGGKKGEREGGREREEEETRGEGKRKWADKDREKRTKTGNGKREGYSSRVTNSSMGIGY